MKNKYGNNIKRSRPALKIVFGALLLVISGAMIATSAVFRFDEWHELDPSLITGCSKSLCIYDKDGELICAAGPEKRIWVEADTLKQHTIDAFVAAEDNRFYTHSGIDLYRIFGAAWADIKAGGYVQGASTISQQLIKLSHLSSEKTLDRKLEEAILATRLERLYDKDEIMEMYLNYIYFGGGYYGIEAAALGYYGVHAAELSAAQSAQLAGIIKSPSAYAPHLDMEASVSRRNNVLRSMYEKGYLSEDEYCSALEEECELSPAFPADRSLYTEYAISEAAELTGISRDELLTGGYSIITAFDSRIADECEKLFADASLFPSDNAQGAMVVLDAKGGIASLIGSRAGNDTLGIDRATRIERQPGSLIKPILVYAPALEAGGYSAATPLKDEPMSFGDYAPRNSDEKYYGTVTLRTAVARSLNIPAVSVLSDIGIPSAVLFAKRLGISFEGEQLGLSLALGGFTHGVSPLEMAGAYSAFSRGGVFIKPYSVNRIVGPNGDTVFERAPNGERVMSDGNAFILTSMLQSVVTEGTGKRLQEAGLPLAAKTGTSVDDNGVRDGWCAAYTIDWTAVVWMGTDNAADGSLPDDAVGGNQPAVLLAKLFKSIYENDECPEFEKPEGITEMSIDISDIDNGVIYAAAPDVPDELTVTEYFSGSSIPLTENPYWLLPSAPEEIGWSIDERGFPVISFVSESALFEYKILRSEMNGDMEAICSFKGKTGYLSFRDENVLPGGSYFYEIEAVHPELTDDDGLPLTSAPSRRLRVVVPYFSQ